MQSIERITDDLHAWTYYFRTSQHFTKFQFTASKAVLISNIKNVEYELPHKLTNDLRPTILGNFREISKLGGGTV